jgi:endonuclease YncB( thermonuclease family)
MTAPLAFDITGRVVAVANGDTLTVLVSNKGKTKISLHQIDAPEKKQDFGQRSKQSLSDLTYGKQVRGEAFDTDKYGRTVGKVWVNGQDANLEQVKRGMAWVYVKYASDPYMDSSGLQAFFVSMSAGPEAQMRPYIRPVMRS